MQLGFDDQSDPEDEGGAEPEDLARVLEASNVGPLAIGLALTIGNLGAMLAAFTANRISGRLGVGRTIILSSGQEQSHREFH